MTGKAFNDSVLITVSMIWMMWQEKQKNPKWNVIQDWFIH